MVKLACVVLVAVVTVTAFNNGTGDEWQWTERESQIVSYLLRGSEKYEISLVRPAGKPNSWLINAIVSQDERELHKWQTHHEGTFTIIGDILVYSTHSPIATGVQITAYDLSIGKLEWQTHLKGVGPVFHSKYRNQINLAVNDGVVTVYGKESSGQYIEKLNLTSGELISNTLGTKEGNAF